MAVVNLHPHLLTYSTEEQGYEDENGDFVIDGTGVGSLQNAAKNGFITQHNGTRFSLAATASGQGAESIPCRAIPAGEAKEVTFDDGTKHTYTYVVKLPPNCHEFKIGEEVVLTLADGRQYTSTVKGFHRYHYQSKLWL
jgi:hypothetical protein